MASPPHAILPPGAGRAQGDDAVGRVRVSAAWFWQRIGGGRIGAAGRSRPVQRLFVLARIRRGRRPCRRQANDASGSGDAGGKVRLEGCVAALDANDLQYRQFEGETQAFPGRSVGPPRRLCLICVRGPLERGSGLQRPQGRRDQPLASAVEPRGALPLSGSPHQRPQGLWKPIPGAGRCGQDQCRNPRWRTKRARTGAECPSCPAPGIRIPNDTVIWRGGLEGQSPSNCNRGGIGTIFGELAWSRNLPAAASMQEPLCAAREAGACSGASRK